MRATFDSFESVLGSEAVDSIVSSGCLDSPTHGGHSWLALATLDTGIRTTNQLDYEVVCAEKTQRSHRWLFPRRRVPHGARSTGNHACPGRRAVFLGFEQKYCHLWDFDYGKVRICAMGYVPDEYVLDFMGQHEVTSAERPLFIQYVLVSSHAPWSDLP